MDQKKECKVEAGCRMHFCEIVGIILLVIATILTLYTMNGMGIFGLFIVGLVFCCHKHMSCNKCPCACCNSGSECDMTDKTCDTKKSKK